MKNWRFFLLFFLIFTITSILAFISQDFVRESILYPLTYLFWLGGLILKSINQEIFWVILVILLLFLMARNLNRSFPFFHKPTPKEKSQIEPTRTNIWAYWISLLGRGGYSRDFSVHEFRRLLITLLAFQKHITLKEAERSLERGELDLPGDIWEELFNPPELIETHPDGFATRLVNRVQEIAGARKVNANRTVDPGLVKLVQFIETQLEIKDKNGNQEGR